MSGRHFGSAPATGLVGAAVARLEEFLLEPAEAGGAAAEPAPAATPGPRPVVAVIGLARRCGATVVARALASELASRDPGGAGAVACGVPGGAIPLATAAARRLARSLEDVPGATTSAVGRLCLVEGADHVALADCSRHLAPLVLDPGDAELETAAAPVADRVLLVAAPRVEQALVTAAISCLRRLGTEPTAVLNMSRGGAGSLAAATAELPYSRTGAQLALGGHQPRGDLGRAVAALADRCEQPA